MEGSLTLGLHSLDFLLFLSRVISSKVYSVDQSAQHWNLNAGLFHILLFLRYHPLLLSHSLQTWTEFLVFIPPSLSLGTVTILPPKLDKPERPLLPPTRRWAHCSGLKNRAGVSQAVACCHSMQYMHYMPHGMIPSGSKRAWRMPFWRTKVSSTQHDLLYSTCKVTPHGGRHFACNCRFPYLTKNVMAHHLLLWIPFMLISLKLNVSFLP